ncbi:MAG TPA: phosphoribosylformylglycinamidine synthase subunit PurS [Tepidisphaeraceae bacterium]|jgi:phosphoribosylformylglycinamidine synthase|nr:phosphoribosylformylglycinamidine synthase subunit PurS [Tepidisphaeraceae bacterium]
MIYRIDVRTTPAARGGQAALDPVGESIRQQIREFGAEVGSIDTSRIFLIDTDADRDTVARAASNLLADPVVESADVMTTSNGHDAAKSRIEIHLKPGVMDPVASSTERALRDMGVGQVAVRTGRAYVIDGKVDKAQLNHIASRVLANGVIESVHFDAYVPERFEKGHDYTFKLQHVNIRELTDEGLTKLSREGHLFLSLTEMKAVQDYFRKQNREPTDAELETVAQTWSEHCVHKTLKSAVDVTEVDESGKPVGSRRYGNLIKETIFNSTQELIGKEKNPFCLSVFKDNAGVIAFDDKDAVCFKVETHNHPSAIEPYGGSATGIGGCIRDIMGTGLAAKPVANTDVFCVAYPDAASSTANRRSQIATLPKGVIHPKRVLQQIVAGVRDYGNRMGIPTVNGALYFDDRYLGNPLVFCGCVGLIPRDKITKAARAGDAIVVMGGRTGRDGIHGATFSSAELTDTHADEFSHAVQIGNAITQKKMADVILQARDRGLFSGITDCGAGGLSSAIGEMGEKTGAFVELGKVPLKYAGLRYDEIWISEAQERMVLSVPQEHVKELLEISALEDVETTVIGTFGTDDRQLILDYNGNEVARIAMAFLHDGIPMPTRKATVLRRGMGVSPMLAVKSSNTIGGDNSAEAAAKNKTSSPADMHGRDAHATVKAKLLGTLAHPNVASKHWVIRQYDHEVQGGSAIKPLIGPQQIGPSDAAVVRPKLESMKGVAIGNGMAPAVQDPYQMAIAAIDEAVRNVVCVGADPNRTAILDNFCWPSVDDEKTMGTLVAACEACRDAALAYGIPFISGKDSLHNQFTNSETGEVLRIPNTLLISAIGIVDDVRNAVTMDLKSADATLMLIAPKANAQLADLAHLHRTVAAANAKGYFAAVHDVSDGGVLTAVAEMAIASGLGASVRPEAMGNNPFAEGLGQYVVEASPDSNAALLEHFATADVAITPLGKVTSDATLKAGNGLDVSVAELTKAWRGTLDW